MCKCVVLQSSEVIIIPTSWTTSIPKCPIMFHSCGAGIVKALQYNKIQPIQPTANPSLFEFSAPHRHADATTYPHMWLQSIEDMYIQPYIHKYCSITECDIDPSYCDHLWTTLTRKCCNFWSSECIMNFLKKFHLGGFWESHLQRTLEWKNPLAAFRYQRQKITYSTVWKCNTA